MVKYAVSAYIADGNTTDYLITWDYLDEDHIVTYVNGTASYDPTSDFTATKINSTTVRVTDEFGAALPSGSEIEIRRETPIQNRAVTFSDGSALLAEDLNKNSDYLLYSMQEVLDTVEAAAQDGALAAQVATEGFRDEAEQHKIGAQTAQTAAETARNTTQTYLATVQSDATDADNHRIAAAASEAAALSSKNAAAASQTAAASSASASATSAAASLASEQASAASQTAAATSATNAASSASAALSSKNAAAVSEANAAASFDSFDDRYLGSKASAPTVDNDGNALLTGALYWNSTSDEMYVWNGASWDTFNSTLGIADAATGAQITITDDKTAINRLRLTATNDASVASTLHAFQIGDDTANNLIIDANEVMARSNGEYAVLAFNPDGGDVVFNSNTPQKITIDSASGGIQMPGALTVDAGITTSTNDLYIGVDNNNTSTYSQIRFRTDGVDRAVLNENDFYVQDNLYLGRTRNGSTDTYTSASQVMVVYGNAGANNSNVKSATGTDNDHTVFFASNGGYTGHGKLVGDPAFKVNQSGVVFAADSILAGRGCTDSTSPTNYYYNAEFGVVAYAATSRATSAVGSTGIYARSVADTSDVFTATIAGNVKVELDADGNCYNDGVWSTTAADYAEMFEWEDGNPDEEDRVGYSVILVGNKIRKATAEDNPALIIGIVSAEPAVLGDNDLKKWSGWAQRDDWGRQIKVARPSVKWFDKSGMEHRYLADKIPEDLEVPEDAIFYDRFETAFADDWDREATYVSRQERQEWDAIGLMGKLRMHSGQPVGDRWIKMRTLKEDEEGNPLIEEWLVR